MSHQAIKKNFNVIIFLNVIGTVLYQAINFLLTPILTRQLDQYDFGVVTLFTSWVHILLPILTLAADSSVGLIGVHIPEKDRNRYYTSCLGLGIVAFLAISSLILIFLDPVARFLQFDKFLVILLLAQCLGMFLVNYAITYYIFRQKPLIQFSISISISISTFFLTLMLLRWIEDPEMKYLCKVIGYTLPYVFVGAIVILLFLFKSRNWFSLSAWKFALPICVPLIFHTLSHLILSQSGKIILQNFGENGVELAGYFGFAFTIASIMQVIWTALNNAWVPFYFQMVAEKKIREINLSANRYMVLYSALFIAFSFIVPEFTYWMGGENYRNATNLILLMLLGIYLVYMYSFPVNYKNYRKKSVSVALGTISAAVVNFVLCLLLVKPFGYYGCAIAMLVAYVVLFLFHQLSIPKNDGEYTFGFRFFLLGFLTALSAVVLSYVLMDFWMT